MKLKEIWIIILAISIGVSIFLIAYRLGGIVQYNHDLDQGKTAQEWEKIYNDFIDVKCTKEDVKWYEDDISGHKPKVDTSLDTVLKCWDGIAAYDEYLRAYPSTTPLPNPTPAPNPYAKMPSYCKDVIQGDEASYQPLNYSQGAINEIVKKDNPECATY